MGENNGLSDAHLLNAFALTNTTTALVEDFGAPQNDINGSIARIAEGRNFESYVGIIVPSIFGVIWMLGLFGNCLVIFVILSDKHMRNTTNILILSLAVADLLFILFCVPFTAAAYALTIWPFGDIGCKMAKYAMYVCAYASVYTLVLMSLDRYLAVVHAIRSMSLRTLRNTWLAISILWAIILCGNIPILIQFGEHKYEWEGVENRSACLNLVEMRDQAVGRTFTGCFFFFGYVLPLGVTVLLYGLMLKRLLYGVVPGGGNQSAESIRAKKRVTRMVVIVVAIFAMCWMPIQLILFIHRFGTVKMEKPLISLMMTANCLAYMNSCVNPILYAFLSENFRRSFKKFLCCSESSRRMMDYERTNVRFTAVEKETNNTCVSSNNKTYTAV